MGLMETPASLQETQAGSVRPPVIGLAGLVVEPVGQGRWDQDAGITTLGSRRWDQSRGSGSGNVHDPSRTAGRGRYIRAT